MEHSVCSCYYARGSAGVDLSQTEIYEQSQVKTTVTYYDMVVHVRVRGCLISGKVIVKQEIEGK